MPVEEIRLTGKGHVRIFWGDENDLYLYRSMITGVYAFVKTQTVTCKSLYFSTINYTCIKNLKEIRYLVAKERNCMHGTDS